MSLRSLSVFPREGGRSIVTLPGHWLPGVPLRIATLSGDQRVPDVFDLTVDPRKTLVSMPMKCSPDRTSHPSRIPSLHLSSNLRGTSLVLGMRKCTISPKLSQFDVRTSALHHLQCCASIRPNSTARDEISRVTDEPWRHCMHEGNLGLQLLLKS